MPIQDRKYAEILPLIKLPKSLGIFDYIVPDSMIEKLSVGQMVKIPYRNAVVDGIIMKIKNHVSIPETKLKTIENVSETYNIPAYLIRVVEWMSIYYFQSPALIAKAAFPKILENKKKFSKKTEEKIEEPGIVEPIKKNIFAEEIFLSQRNAILYKGSRDENLFLELAEKIIKEKKQILIIFPEVRIAEIIFTIFKNRFNSSVGLLHSKVPTQKYYEVIRDASDGKLSIIIGTKKAIFCPLPHLAIIIFDEEENPSHKQWDQNPRYSAREVAQKISDEISVKLIFRSSHPTVETYFKIQQNKIQLIDNKEDKNIRPEIIQMSDERKRKNFSILSEAVFQVIEESIKNFQRSILIVNRKGFSTFIQCRDCLWIPKCERCQNIYRYYEHNKKNELLCHNCGFSALLPPFCPVCNSTDIRFSGLGLRQVEKFVRSTFSRLKVFTIDQEKKIQNKEKTVSDFLASKPSILVATQEAFHYDFTKLAIDNVIFANADQFLVSPDLYGTYRAWNIFSKALEISKRRCMLQTFSEKNSLYNLFASRKEELFYAQEIAQRKQFGYPPFGRLVKCILSDISERSCLIKAQNFYSALVKNYTSKQLQFFGPLPAYPFKMYNKFRYLVIIKATHHSEQELSRVLQKAPDSVIIDTDPESII